MKLIEYSNKLPLNATVQLDLHTTLAWNSIVANMYSIHPRLSLNYLPCDFLVANSGTRCKP